MGLHQQFLSLIGLPPPLRAEIAGIKDQIIEIGTHVRFMELNPPKPPPRDDAGRFVSPSKRIKDELAGYVTSTTHEQRLQEFEHYVQKTRAALGKHRGRE